MSQSCPLNNFSLAGAILTLQLDATHHEHDIKRLFVHLADRLEPICCAGRIKPQPLQDGFGDPHIDLIILDEQHLNFRRIPLVIAEIALIVWPLIALHIIHRVNLEVKRKGQPATILRPSGLQPAL